METRGSLSLISLKSISELGKQNTLPTEYGPERSSDPHSKLSHCTSVKLGTVVKGSHSMTCMGRFHFNEKFLDF